MKNISFKIFIIAFQKIMPFLAISATILAYFASGKVHADVLLVLSPAMGWANCMLIGYSIAFVAGLIVYFPIMNDVRPSLGFQGEIAAIFFGVLRVGGIIYESGKVESFEAIGYSMAVLMFAASLIELYLLQVIKAHIKYDLVQSGNIDKLIENEEKMNEAEIKLQMIQAKKLGFQNQGLRLKGNSSPKQQKPEMGLYFQIEEPSQNGKH